MRLPAIIEALGRVGLADYPSPRVAGLASALVEGYKEATKTAWITASVAAVIDIEPAAGRGSFDMRGERF